MTDLAAGTTVTVVNPSDVVAMSSPGVVASLWLKEGPPGPQGQTGATGPQGPKGDTGATGSAGSTGPVGPANTLTIGSVTTGAPGSLAAAAVTGVAPNQSLSLTIPKGDKGDTGATGPQGPQGIPGSVSTVNGDAGPAVVLDAADVGAVPTTRTITAGTGLTGGGDLSANRSLAVSYGTTSGTAAQGNDSRLSDARTPTAHTHVATTDLTATGTKDATTFLRGDNTWATPGGGGGPIAVTKYSPSTIVTLTTTSTSPVDADATNLAVTFTAPASGKVIVVLTSMFAHSNGNVATYWSLRSGTTNVPGSNAMVGYLPSPGRDRQSARCYITGLTPGNSYSYKWAHRTTSGTATLYAGTAGDEFASFDDFGPALMEVWSA